MPVPVSRRKPHDFQASRQLREIRRKVTELALYRFGYDKEKYEEKIKKFERSLTNLDPEKKAEVVAKMRKKNETYYADFVKEETAETRRILREAVCEFELGNSIFPSGEALIEEFKERRLHIDRAIGYMYSLKQELEYIAEILPSNKNSYKSLIDEIQKEVALMKGVRQSANKFLKKKEES